jgi:hypothetical protein
MATTRNTPAPVEHEVDPGWADDDVDPWEGFTPEERERGWRILTPEEGREQFDRAARRRMGISGDEFIRRWDAGEYDEIADKDGHRHIMQLAGLIGFARQDD